MGDEVYIVGIYCGVHCRCVCIVGAYILWVHDTHNIYVLHPQHIPRVYILWVYVVGDFSFTDVVKIAESKVVLQEWSGG